MNIVADENIPYVREAFGALGHVTLCPGRQISPEVVRDADVLFVRSVKRIDEALLDGSRVRFVGSATIGTDHLDEDYLKARRIAYAHAPGSNAESVVEYVLAALLVLCVRRRTPLRGKTVGVVGCGNIGGRLAGRLEALGVHALKNDPPLAEAAMQAGTPHAFVPLEEVLERADVVSLHVPLTRKGCHPTYHLLDADALHRMKPDAWLINTCRGAVVSNRGLKAVRKMGNLGAVVLDVWENEPTPDFELLPLVSLATPHIAGYSYDGKVQGTIMLYQALMRHLGRAPSWDAAALLEPTPEDRCALSPPPEGLAETEWLDALVRQMYDIEGDDARFRTIPGLPQPEQGRAFSLQRTRYPRRRGFACHRLSPSLVPEAYREAVENGLGILLEEGV